MFRKIIFKHLQQNIFKCKVYNTLPHCAGYSKKAVESSPSVFKKYEPFRDDKAPVILDVEEERQKNKQGVTIIEEEIENAMYRGISPRRGVHGVIDLEELVKILQKENAQDIFVAKIPEEHRYVEHIVIVTGRSSRHMQGIAEFVRQVYKFKVNGVGPIPLIEGKKSKDWLALDLGNIALHVFSRSKRPEYDLESLWSVGAEFDEQSNKSDEPIIQLLTNYNADRVS